MTFDAVTTAGGEYPASLTWTHTTGTGDYRLLIVAVGWVERNAGANASGITYDGQALTKIRSDDYEPATAEIAGTELWYLKNPPSGAKSVVASFAGGSGEVAVAAVTFASVNQTTPIGDHNGWAGREGVLSTTVTSDTGDMVLDATADLNAGVFHTPGAGQTERWDIDDVAQTGHGGFAGSTEPGASSVTMSWSDPGTEMTISAVNIKQAP